jgi:uncharacterized membrane protein
MERNKSLYRVILIGLMAAMVFVVTTFLKIDIPTPTGKTMIKLGNAVCILSGLLLGGVGGGLASGIGSMFYDLLDPAYAPEFWITFIRFFLTGMIAGLISHAAGRKGRSFQFNLIAAIAAALFSYLFYIGQSVLVLMAAAMDFSLGQLGRALVASAPKLVTGGINALTGVVVSVLLAKPLMLALDRAGLLTKIELK